MAIGAMGCGSEVPVGSAGSSSDTTPSSTTEMPLPSTGRSASGSGDDVDSLDGDSTSDPVTCECAPQTDQVVVISDDGELWTFDPLSLGFTSLGTPACGGFSPFSMALDRRGVAWILLLDNIPHATVAKGLFQVDLAEPDLCTAVVYEEGLFGVFGTSFVTNDAVDNCERLYVQSYSGQGGFSEGPDSGHLGVLTDRDVLQSFGTIDFDGGELAGTGDGRLFSLSGAQPARIIEFDKQTAQPLSTLELTGFPKTNASAMAFWGGDFYLFTEASNPECTPCLERMCTDELAACEAEPGCDEVLDCLLSSGGEGPQCQGDIKGPGGPLRDCLFASCSEPCAASGVVSRVTHVDWDESDGAGQAWTVIVDAAPMRVVGAGSSTCAPVAVP